MIPDPMRPIRHEVWRQGWAYYRIEAVYPGGGLLGRRTVVTVPGRRRAVRRADRLQQLTDDPPPALEPVYRTAAVAPRVRGRLQLLGEAVTRDLHPVARKGLLTRAILAGWVEARQRGISPPDSDAIIGAALDGALGLLERWGREPDYEPESEDEEADRT